MDNYYNLIPLAEHLLKKKITVIGTLKSNRRGIPSELKSVKDHAQNSWAACKSNNVELNSYVVKTKSSGYRNVLLINTMNSAHFVTDDKKEKRYFYKVYDYTKVGVDIPDQRIASYKVKSKTCKWTWVANFYLLDVACINAQTIASENGFPPKSSFGFVPYLVMALGKPSMGSRLEGGGSPIFIGSIHNQFCR